MADLIDPTMLNDIITTHAAVDSHNRCASNDAKVSDLSDSDILRFLLFTQNCPMIPLQGCACTFSEKGERGKICRKRC